MMSDNESMTASSSPGDAPACGISVHDPSVLVDSVRDRLAWIDERVNEAHQFANSNSGGMMSVQRLQELFSIVEEFAELLRVHFAGVES
jgi:hypothetical protein